MDVELGHDFKVVNYTIDTNAKDITITYAFKMAYIQARGESDWILRRKGTDSAFFTVKSGSGVKLTVHRIPDSGTTTTICDARVASGTETLEVIFTV